MLTPIRERIVDRLERQLALTTSATVRRNYRAAVDLATLDPPWFINVLEGDHTVDHETSGIARYALTITLRLVVGGTDDATLPTALNALYAETLLAAYQGNRRLGGLAIDVAEQAAEIDTADDAGTSAAMAMVLTLRIEFETREDDPTVAP